MELVNEMYDQMVDAIIRPPRGDYTERDLGKTVFTMGNKKYKRVDFELTNKRGHKIYCSQYFGLKHRERMPVVIYCHGNAGCRLDAEEATKLLLPMDISVVSFDFSGSGMSGGEYVSLGYFEQHDLTEVVDHLRKSGKTTRIGLWGRSMGAATSLMFGVSDPSIACMVLDSPFSSLKVLSNELVTKYEVKIPKMVVSIAFKMIKKSVEKKAGFDIEKLEPIKSAPNCFIPALFAHAIGDDFIDISHSELICQKYSGDHNLIKFDGDHVTRRPRFFHDSVSIFISNHLLVESDFEDNPWIEEEGEEEEFIAETWNFYQDDVQDQSVFFTTVEEDEEAQLRLALELSMKEAEKTVHKIEVVADQTADKVKESDKPKLENDKLKSEDKKTDKRKSDNSDKSDKRKSEKLEIKDKKDKPKSESKNKPDKPKLENDKLKSEDKKLDKRKSDKSKTDKKKSQKSEYVELEDDQMNKPEEKPKKSTKDKKKLFK